MHCGNNVIFSKLIMKYEKKFENISVILNLQAVKLKYARKMSSYWPSAEVYVTPAMASLTQVTVSHGFTSWWTDYVLICN